MSRATALAGASFFAVLAFAAPATAGTPGTAVQLFSFLFAHPVATEGVAVDGSGDVFFGVKTNSRLPGADNIDVIAPSDTEPDTRGAFSIWNTVHAGQGINDPEGLALDESGDLFVASTSAFPLLELPADTPEDGLPQPLLSTPLTTGGLAVDGTGANAYLVDAGNDQVLDVPIGNPDALEALPFSGLDLTTQSGIALDSAGDLFVSDTGNDRVVELPAAGGPQISIPFPGTPLGIGVDSTGDLFVATGSSVIELMPDGRAITLPSVSGGIDAPTGVAVDSSGDVYITGTGRPGALTVDELFPQLSQTISFTSTPPAPGFVGDTYDLSATGGGSGNPVVFSIDGSSTTGACSLSGTTVQLVAPGTCVVDADQVGSSEYLSADRAQQSFDITTAFCAAGTFSATGHVPCDFAPPGSFVDTVGATSATPCAVGTYQDASGQTSCIQAPPGSYVSASGATSATPCALGTFQPLSGQTSCNLSPPGTYVNTTGASTAVPCALGTFQPSSGSTSCITAPIGTYVATIGAVATTPCPVGTTTSAPGATSGAACHVTSATLEALVRSTFANPTPYLASLDAAAASAARGNWTAAANQVGAFLNKLQAALSAGKITQGQFDLLDSLGAALQSAYSAGHNP